MSKDYYKILGVGETASHDEIKKSYRSLSLKWHPDKNNGDEANGKFQEINEAYEILGDEQKRREYNLMKSNINPFFNNMDIPIDNIFSALFGNGGMSGFMSPMPPGMSSSGNFHTFNQANSPFHFVQALQKPTPIIKNISITIEQVYTGANIPIEIDRWLMENNNKVFEREIIYVPIPKGIDEGEIIIIREKGNMINDTIKGDIKIFVKIEPNATYKRKGLDILVNHTISLKDALCGFTTEFKHINGKVYTLNNNKANIVQPGHTKIIPNMGFTRENHTGSLMLTFTIEFPSQLTPEQIKTIQEIL